MGKQGRRKQRQKRQQQRKQEGGVAGRDPSAPVNPSSALHQLRHADPKVRQNALIALQATIVQPSAKRINISVMEAVREQVMDSNLECASAAAECLAQYLAFTNNMEHQAATTASWTVVLITRLGQCHQAVLSKHSKIKLWYALAAPCLKTLCKLIEINDKALEQIMSSESHIDAFLSMLLGLMQCVSNAETTSDANLIQWAEETATYAARTMHSSLDENPEIADRINSKSADPKAWAHLLANLPALTQLHICGSLVAVYQISPSAWLATFLVQHVLSSLSIRISIDPQRLQSLEQEYYEAAVLHEKQKADEQLESEIVRKIQDRKEPAKIIAKRQKEVDRGSKAVINDEDTKDGQQAMEEAFITWTEILEPVQLALEVVANLLSCFIRDDDAMDQDDAGAEFDQPIVEAMIATNWYEGILKVLQLLCSYKITSANEDAKLRPLHEELNETISKSAACMANCVLSTVLDSNNFQATWQVLRPFAQCSGVCSVLVVLAQNHPEMSVDTELIRELLKPDSSEETKRDGICLLAMSLGRGMGTQSIDVVNQATQEMLRLLKDGPTVVRIEILSAIMDLWGQDEFYPDLFVSHNILAHFQSALASLSSVKSSDPEAEEILYNAERFVEYKQG